MLARMLSSLRQLHAPIQGLTALALIGAGLWVEVGPAIAGVTVGALIFLDFAAGTWRR